MAKQECKNCGAVVGLLQQIKLNDGNYICRKCASKVHPLFEPVNQRTFELYKEHLKQLEEGQLLYEKLFVPRKKHADKSKRLKKIGGLEVAKDIGLIAAVKKRGGFLFWGGVNYYMVFRLADLFEYEYSKETSFDINNKKNEKHFVNYAFWDTPGCSDFRVEVIGETFFINAAKYFNECFGLKRDIVVDDSWKKQIDNIKTAAKSIKSLFTGKTEEAKTDEVVAMTEEQKKQLYGDRTEWIAKADIAIKEAKG